MLYAVVNLHGFFVFRIDTYCIIEASEDWRLGSTNEKMCERDVSERERKREKERERGRERCERETDRQRDRQRQGERV